MCPPSLIVTLIAVAALAGSLLLAPFIGAEFLSTLDGGAISIKLQRLPSISLP